MVEIQIIFSSRPNITWSNFPINLYPEERRAECTIGENTRDWTNWFFNSFRQWLVSQLLDHIWTWNKVYLEAPTFASTNNEKTILKYSEIFFKNTIFWLYSFFLLQSVQPVIIVWKIVWYGISYDLAWLDFSVSFLMSYSHSEFLGHAIHFTSAVSFWSPVNIFEFQHSYWMNCLQDSETPISWYICSAVDAK